MGLKGNLSAGEIVEQLVHALRVTPVRNVVFMVRARRRPCGDAASGLSMQSLCCAFAGPISCMQI